MAALAGVEPLHLPAKSPNSNAYAKRFVLSIKSECLDRLVLLGERHLRTVIRELVTHYHRERNHQGMDGQLIEFSERETRSGPIQCRQRLGGLLRYCHRETA